MANDIEELYLNGTRYGFNDERLANKANIDGAYEGMTVGNAEQLVSSVRVTDKTPYLFRPAGGNLDIGDRKYTTLVGADVVENQLVQNTRSSLTRNDVVWTNNGDGTWTANGLASADSYCDVDDAFSIPVGHKCLIIGCPSGGSFSTYWLQDGYRGVYYSGDSGGGRIYEKTTADTIVRMYVGSGYNANNLRFRPQFIDLTQMLGTAIADTARAKEQAETGSGIAWLKANGFDFSKYRAYNAESLESVNPSAIVTRGFNQWDEEWEVGGYANANGQPWGTTDRIRSKATDYIKICPNTTYYFRVSQIANVYYYDANKDYISTTTVNNETFTTPANAYYMRFSVQPAYGTTYNHDICINLHWDGSRDGEYEPYIEHEYALGNVPLHGIFKEENGNIVAYGDTRTSDGTKTNNFGQVDLGTLTWSKSGNHFYTRGVDSTVKVPSANNVIANIVCSKYVTAKLNDVYDEVADKGIAVQTEPTTSAGVIQVYDSAYSSYSDAQFKTAMSGVMLTYELATPTTDTVDPFTNPQVVDNWGTEEFTTENDVPVGNETEYPQNLRDKLETIPNPPNGDGDYIVRQTGGTGEYRAVSDNAIIQGILAKLPNAPTEDGTYKLTCTVADGTATYSWESEE